MANSKRASIQSKNTTETVTPKAIPKEKTPTAPAGPDKTLSFKIDYETWRSLKMICMERNVTLNDLLISTTKKLAKGAK